MLRYLTSIITTLVVSLFAFSIHSGAIFAHLDDSPRGSIKICKVIADQNGVISNGSDKAGSFSFLETTPYSFLGASSLPETHFATPTTLNADVIGNDGINDAQCVTYSNLPISSYAYGEEQISGTGWSAPLYNDQYTASISSLSDFFTYDSTLFGGSYTAEEYEYDNDGRNRNADGLIILTTARPDRTLVVLNRFVKDIPPAPTTVTVVASKIICDNEADLPNFGNGGPDITASTAQDFVSAHSTCHLQANWNFEWGNESVTDPGRDFVGVAGNGWHTFGVTNVNGIATTTIVNTDLQGGNKIWVREVLKTGYIPFTFDQQHQNNSNATSAEMYCHDDVLNYDNFDFIRNPELGKTYYCVAWNVLKSPVVVNTPPAITLLGAATTTITVGDTFTDPGATAADAEDGNITANIVVTGSVATSTVGTYTLHYNVQDSQELAAPEKTRTVVVNPVGTCTVPIDVIIVLDRSDSMGYDGHHPIQPLTDAERAAKSFIDTLNTTTDHVGLVTFAKEASLQKPLTSDFASVKTSIDGLTLDGWTNIGDAVRIAHEELNLHGRSDAKKVIILLSDGDANRPLNVNPTQYALSQASLAKTSGVVIYSIGLGGDINQDLLLGIATAQSFYYFSPTSDKLQEIYLSIAEIECEREVNTPPAITLLGAATTTITVGDTFTDPGATAADAEDGNITANIVVTGSVATSTVGTYTLHYNVQDSQGLAAPEKTRTVVVNEAPMCRLPQFTSAMSVHTTLGTAFSYTITATSTGTTTPVFTVATSSLPSGLLFSLDTISGTTTVVGTFNVAVSTANMCGTTTATLSIIVDPNGGGGGHTPECSDSADNDQDGKTDAADPACHTDGNPNNPGTYTPTIDSENSAPVITVLGANPMNLTVGNIFTDPGASAFDEEDGAIATSSIVVTGTVNTSTAGTYTIHYNVKDSKGLSAEEKTRTVNVANGGGGGGGGGGGCTGNCGGSPGAVLIPSLQIFNETIEKTPLSGVVLIRWQTNVPADSRVVYGTASVPVLGEPSVNYGYQFGTSVVTDLVTTHTMAVSGLNPAAQYYFRPVSKKGTLSATGKELSLAVNAPSECYYLREFIKFGADNNPEEVKKLQVFLNSFEGSSLPVTGFYDMETLHVLNAFQAKYKIDVLDPWGHDEPTGFVYLTTRKKVNEIYCHAAFPLTHNQLEEVSAFKKLLESLKIHGIIPLYSTNVVSENETGIVLGTTTPTTGEVDNETVATESPVSVTGRSAFRNMLGAAYAAVSKAVTSYWLVFIFAALVVITGVLLKKLFKEEEGM